jgi:hypothetical protein
MPRYRYDKDLECLVEIREGSNYFEPSKGPHIISDIEPYRAIASDIACDGKRPMITGRRQHREFLQRNGYVEVGNESGPTRSDMPSARELQADRAHDIKRAMGEYGSNTGADAAAYHMRRNQNGR